MTQPYYSDERVTVIHADCLDALAAMPAASVHAIVTDPPYGLGFMGKAWDDLPPGEAWARECLRVLKPGGHLLAFGGTRTWHRLACAVEDAGFEMRDSIAWLYGSGFPKSLDVSKAIDKRRDDTDGVRVVCRWLRARIDEHPTESVRTIAARFGFHPRMVEHWAARDTDSQPTLPTLDQWDALREVLDFTDELDAEVWRLNGRKGSPGEAWDSREVTGQHEQGNPIGLYEYKHGEGNGRTANERRDTPATPDAERWQGWGTALKPAFEPVVVARKPLAGTVAANVLAWGTGALNVDGCRVGVPSEVKPQIRATTDVGGGSWSKGEHVPFHYPPGGGGRWPANVLLDEEMARRLDEQSGELISRLRGSHNNKDRNDGEVYGAIGADVYNDGSTYGDSGGASRFFYTAKATSAERPRVAGVAHPTVKPLALMRWLVRLVTPPGGVVLDPFAGSGTTLEAAIVEGFRCIGIEREADYLPLILHRIERAQVPLDLDGGAA